MSVLIQNGMIVQFDERRMRLKKGSVLIEDNYISDIVFSKKLRAKYDTKIDASGKFILPGLICMHTHAYSAFSIGMKCARAKNFEQILKKIWWRLDKCLSHEDIYYSGMLTAISAVKCGTTMIFDHHSSPNAIKNSLIILASAFQRIGIRANLCYEVSDRNGVRNAHAAILENEAFAQAAARSGRNDITASIGLHASMTVCEETLLKCTDLKSKTKLGIHIHVAEDLIDVNHTIRKYGTDIVERLARAQLLDKKALCIHTVKLSGKEIKRLKQTNAVPVHCPRSNMNNAVGVAPVVDMLSLQIPVALGTDGYTQNMFAELKTAHLVHKLTKGADGISSEYLKKIIFVNNPMVASNIIGERVGFMKEGALADIIIVDYKPSTPITSENFMAHLLFGIDCNSVDTVIIDGKIIMEDKVLKTVYEQDVYEKTLKMAEKVWSKMRS